MKRARTLWNLITILMPIYRTDIFPIIAFEEMSVVVMVNLYKMCGSLFKKNLKMVTKKR